MNILGINAYHGDASVALVKDGQLVGCDGGGAAQPAQALRRLPGAGGEGGAGRGGGQRLPSWITWPSPAIPRPTSTRKILFAIQKRPSFTKLVKDRPRQRGQGPGRRRGAGGGPVGSSRARSRAKFHAVEHHKSHTSRARSSSRRSRRPPASSIDGFGDFVSTMRGVGRDRKLEILDRIEFPHSAGLFYGYTAVSRSSSAFTATARSGR